MPGLFVTFEGGEGSGKSTQIERLAARLRAAGHDPLVTREPGGTPLAEAVREVLLDPAHRPVALAEALLMEAARADLVERVVRPALASGRIVVCDRYGDSTLAYQGGGRGLDLALLRALNAAATGGLTPDLTVLIDVDPGTGLARRGAAGAPNRLDREPEEFHARVRARYRALAEAEPDRFRVLDGRESADRIETLVWEAVSECLAARAGRPGAA